MRRIYLDNNSTTAVAPEVLEAMGPWFRERPANPSSPHPEGEAAADALRRARGQVARLLGDAAPDEVVFTSGGSEGIATAFHTARARRRERPRVVVSSVEHSAVKRNAERWAAEGGTATSVGVDRDGRLDRDALGAAIDGRCALVSLMLANNETGVLSDLAGVGEACHAAGALFHVDAVQGPGKLPLDPRALSCDLLTISAHKFCGPKGVGALWVRGGLALVPLILGGPQEGERRAGTENVPGIVGLGCAAERAAARATDGAGLAALAALRDRLEAGLLERVEGARVHGGGAPRVSNTTNVLLPGAEATLLLALLGERGVCASAGSACNAHRLAPSPVLLAMGATAEEAACSLRLSLGHDTGPHEVEAALEAVVDAVATLRALA